MTHISNLARIWPLNVTVVKKAKEICNCLASREALSTCAFTKLNMDYYQDNTEEMK